jgi:dihydropteroate synthase
VKDTSIYPKRTFNCKGILHSFDRPLVMGILNVTPDSFYAPSRSGDWSEIILRVQKMLSQGLDILDLGGYSSRPGAVDVSEDEELQRVIPVIEKMHHVFPDLIISIDTFRSQVADEALFAGASIINDISGGGLDPEIYGIAAKHKAPYILMHMRGTPQTMGQFTSYDSIIQDMLFYFSEKIELAKVAGLTDIILDPGIGFSKTPEQNFEVLANLHRFRVLECPILLGVSRKSTICKTLNISAEESLNGTTVLNTLGLLKGADILRVHDVLEAKQAIQLIQKTGLIN